MLFKAIPASYFREIQKGECSPSQAVPVYYGYDNYRDDPDHVNKLVRAVLTDYPNMAVDDMHIRWISRQDSDRHAHMTTVQVIVDAEVIKQNLHQYTIL